jgi:hypothetical protein
MKIRYGFVSNSSSSSFICNARYMDLDGVESISKEEISEKAHKLFDFIVDMKLAIGVLAFDDIFKEPFKATKKYIKYLNGWNADIKYSKDLIILESAYDNSIPSCMFEVIEELFHAYRIHLG